MKSRCVFTSCNLAYLSRAQALASTFKKHNPGIDFILLLADRSGDLGDMQFFDRIIEIPELSIKNFWVWAFTHNVIELCTAVKPFAAQYLLGAYEEVIYLDPDIAVYSSLGPVFRAFDQSDILLTPHQLTPCPNHPVMIEDIELCSSKHGIYNLGFFGVKRAAGSFLFLEWWSERLYHFCHEDTARGIFTDQKWCDFVPVFFDRVNVLKNPGLNVASWNLFERSISIRAEGVFVNANEPLVFYHFTKFGGVGTLMTKRYAQGSDTLELWFSYGLLLEKFSRPSFSGLGAYNCFESGEVIQPESRKKLRSLRDKITFNPYTLSNARILALA